MTEAPANTPIGRAVPAMQFDDLGQQREAAGLGMWTFLVTEVMFFGGLFTGYTIYRIAYPDAFAEASSHLYMWIGAANTFILLTSSLTMALSVHAAATGRRRPLLLFLVLTMALGAAFLGIKAVEYAIDFQDRIVPGPNFAAEHFTHPDQAQLFLAFYFIMTGIHAVHMIIGLGIMLVILAMAWRGRFTPDNHNAVEMTGLYWHFVDIVWIFLFPLLYLIGV